MYKKFTSEQLERAYNADIIEFLKGYAGFDFTQKNRFYECKQHDSLIVCGDRKSFFWNSKNIRGGGAVDFLQRIEGMSFPEAVEAVIGERVAEYKPAPEREAAKTAGKLVLPEKTDGKYSRVFAYLSQSRGLSAEVISDFIKSKQIYQDVKGNCVFVGYDEKGEAKFDSVRGTLTEKKYRGDCKNSDKRYTFHQIGTDTTRLYIFEAPIDLLSHCTMTDEKYGIKGAYKKQTRITLCGTSDVALEAFLERHPEVKVLNFRLDNDNAGKKAVKMYKDKYEAKGYVVNAVFSTGKDINEDLIKQNKSTKRAR